MQFRLIILACCLLGASVPSFAFKLITDDEAKLPNTATLKSKGITRGPNIKLVSPDLEAGAVKSPFNLKIVFEPHGGAKIEPASVNVTYLKVMPVNLLNRVKPGLSETGIELSGAEAPPGEHMIQISMQDTDGRKATTVVVLKVAN